MTSEVLIYDPRISTLIDSTDDDWGDPEENRANMIRYNVGEEFDNALWGIPVGYESELITIQGQIKNRKSTLLCNLVLNWAIQLKEKGNSYWICIDTLESGMSPKSYRDQLLAMIATRLIVAEKYGNDRTKWPHANEIVQQSDLKPHLTLSRKFLRFGRRTPVQVEALERAKRILKELPITLFGPAISMGKARDLEASMIRWVQLYDGTYPNAIDYKHRIFALDHVQQYGGGNGDYSNLERATTAISDFAASSVGSIVVALSQVSLSSIRDAEAGTGKMRAKGGEKLAAESNLVLEVRYDRERNPTEMTISASEGRDETPPIMVQPIQPSSGVALGPAVPAVRRRGD